MATRTGRLTDPGCILLAASFRKGQLGASGFTAFRTDGVSDETTIYRR